MRYNHATALEHIVNNPREIGVNRDYIDFMLIEPKWWFDSISYSKRMPDLIMRQQDLGFYVVELKASSSKKKYAKTQLDSGVDFIKEYFEWDYVNPIIAYYGGGMITHTNLPFVFRK